MGKLSLLLVLGFSVLYMMLGSNSSNLSTQTVENMAEYNANTIAHNIAVSGTNIACNQIFQNGTWDAGYKDINFEDLACNSFVETKNIKEMDYYKIVKISFIDDHCYPSMSKVLKNILIY